MRGTARLGLAATWLALSIAALPLHAIAQDDDTGGSFESSDWGSSDSSGSGSDWGSGGSGSSDSWGTTSPSESYPRTDYDTSTGDGSYAPSHDPGKVMAVLDLAFVAGVVLWVLILVVVALRRVGPGRRSEVARGLVSVRGPSAPVAPGRVDVSMLQLAVDWRARKFVQAKLDALARSGDTATQAGRARLLAATTSALREVKLAWLYGGARNYAPMPQADAQRELQTLTNDVRASFRKEIVRAANGRVVTVESQGVAKPTDGPGIVLVSVIVASRREIFDADAHRAASLERLLDSLDAQRPADVIALSVVWTPAAEGDRMSTDELAQRHPHLARLGDVGGRVFCAYCSGPYAQELPTCPHCGAPNGAQNAGADAKKPG